MAPARRAVRARVLLALCLVLAGCAAPTNDGRSVPTRPAASTVDVTPTPTPTPAPPSEGDLRVEPVTSAPTNATVVPFDNETVQRAASLRRAVARADREDAFVSVHLEGEEFHETAAALDRLPMHGGDDFGYYVRKGNRTFRVVLAVYE